MAPDGAHYGIVSGRHRLDLSLRGGGVVFASAAAISVVLAGSWLGYMRMSASGCTGQLKIAVAAAPEIAPAVRQIASQWTASGARVQDTCVVVAVTSAGPADVASAIARQHQVALTGLSTAPATVAVPDVWLPDSSIWLLRLESVATGFVPTDGTSMAQSPVVVAMPAPVAAREGWAVRQPSWSDLVKQINADRTLRIGTVDPTRDATGLSGLLALTGDAGPASPASVTAALRALAAGNSTLRDDLLQKFPRTPDPDDLAGSLAAAPLSEADVISYNAQQPPVRLAALYPQPAALPLDYPFAVMPGIDLLQAAAATGLREALDSADFQTLRARVGLRDPAGGTGTGFAVPSGAPVATAAPTGSPARVGAVAAGLDVATINRAISAWVAVKPPGRTLG
jgi:Ca-activated chloride channel family protein